MNLLFKICEWLNPKGVREKHGKHTSHFRAARDLDCYLPGFVRVHFGGASSWTDSTGHQQEGTENIVGDARRPGTARSVLPG
jgi:hypothetical protein